MLGICMICLPLGHTSMASLSIQSLDGYAAYPKPSHKPLQCIRTGKDNQKTHAYINKKQAVVTALGLYLGLKKATAQKTVKRNGCEKV